MTDLIDISSTGIVLRDTDGSVRFDTAEGLFHPTDSLSGSQALSWGAYNASTSYNLTNSYAIGTCMASSTIVTGALWVDGDTETPSGLAFSANGTYVHRMHWLNAVSDTRMLQVRHAIAYTFEATGGVVYLRERICMLTYDNGGLQSLLGNSLVPFTLHYSLKIGRFT